MVEILRRTYCSTVGVEYMHISDPEAKQWIQERMEGPDKETVLRARQARHLNKLIEAEGFEKFLDVKYTGTKRFGLTAPGADPALEQIIKRGGALGSGHRPRHGPSRPAERADPGDGQPHRALFHEFRAAPSTPRRSRARATSSITSAPPPTATSTATRCTCR